MDSSGALTPSTAPAAVPGVVRRGAQIVALQIVLQARALIQVPFLTHWLSIHEFGSLSLARAVAGTAGVLTTLGLQTGFYLNLVRLETGKTRAAAATVLGLAVPLVGLLGFLTTLALRAGIGTRWLPGVPALAVPLGLLIAGSALREVATVVARARQDVAFFWAISLWIHYGGFLAGLWLVRQGHGPNGFLLGLGAGALSGSLVAVAYSLRRSSGPLSWDPAFLIKVV